MVRTYYLGGAGEAGGLVNAHYGRDPIVEITTTITDRYAPLDQTVIAGTAGEAIHALDGILGHESNANLSALHVDGGGVSDIVFAVMHLLGLDFEPRIPRLSDRRLYAFEAPNRYGRLAPLFGHKLNRDLVVSHWPDIQRVIDAMRSRTVTPSLILKKLSAYRQNPQDEARRGRLIHREGKPMDEESKKVVQLLASVISSLSTTLAQTTKSHAAFTHAAVVVTGAAILDAELERCIKTKCRTLNNKMSKRLFGYPGPLSSFAARIDVAYALEITTNEIHRNWSTLETSETDSLIQLPS